MQHQPTGSWREQLAGNGRQAVADQAACSKAPMPSSIGVPSCSFCCSGAWWRQGGGGGEGSRSCSSSKWLVYMTLCSRQEHQAAQQQAAGSPARASC
jgi:hypothetical protein